MSEEHDLKRDPDGQIQIERRGRILMMGIDRPEKRNGFTPKMLSELAKAHTLLESDPGLRCGVIHAFGDHTTAGLDLPKIAALQAEGKPLIPANEVDPFSMREPLRTKPVVIALKGISYTTAVSLALSSDIAIAADNCRFGIVEVKRGIIAGLGGIARLVDRAGWGNAMRYLLTGAEFDAHEALRLNCVQEVVPLGQELTRAVELAELIAEQAPLAVQATIANAREFLHHGWHASVAHISDVRRRLYVSDDAKEGVAAFKEKRRPRFTGK